MKVQKLGHFVDGREVHLFTMENKNGVMASFTDLGGVWLSLLFPKRERNRKRVSHALRTILVINKKGL